MRALFPQVSHTRNGSKTFSEKSRKVFCSCRRTERFPDLEKCIKMKKWLNVGIVGIGYIEFVLKFTLMHYLNA